MTVVIAFLIAVLIALPASAHPGKTDRQGGHKCYKECAEWDLYYAEYHLHDKDGKAVRVARKKTVRPVRTAAPVGEKVVITADRPAEAAPTQPVAVAAVAVEPDVPPLPWLLLLLFLFLFIAVRRNRRKASETEQAAISK